MKAETVSRPLDILLVEDNRADIRLAEKAIRASGINYRLIVVRDGAEALQYLREPESGTDLLHRPDLVLLDLNMPRRDGREVLSEIKSDDRLRSIPVVILTTSEAESDIQMAYRLHANSYVVKPMDVTQFMQVVGVLARFWDAHLPRNLSEQAGSAPL
ncbi:MAG TPA: response regulator [Armatimonadota bacterium]|jgi:CheY-like chemotaxis protein